MYHYLRISLTGGEHSSGGKPYFETNFEAFAARLNAGMFTYAPINKRRVRECIVHARRASRSAWQINKD